MKKIIFGTILLSSSAIQAMIVPIDNDARISRRSESIVARLDDDASITRSADQQLVLDDSTTSLSTRVNFRQVRDPVRLGDRVRISIRDFIDEGGERSLVGSQYTKMYPLQKALLRYHHDIASGFSNPVQELFAMVTDIEHADRHGKIVVNPEYMDAETQIPHQTRETGSYQMDDCHLRAKPFTEIFMTTNSGSVIVDEAKARDRTPFIAYTLIDRSEPAPIGEAEARADDAEFNYQRTETTERWRRPDTTIYTKRTEGVQKVEKTRPPAPVQAAPPIVVQQQPPRPRSPRTFGDGVRNVLTFGSNCTIQ
ncbi:MAG: hypothetical protein LBB12_03755 [Holosporaceae bacterium]|nr:hypothetical protein [Holosporaceae bacterium]